MRKTFLTIISCLAVPSLLMSCLGDDTTTYEATSEALITEFSINDIETSVASLTTAGEDTTLTVTTTGDDYAFTINQSENTIYNNDSLPVGTDVTKVSLNISILGYAVTYEKNNTDTLWTSTDSLDFTNPIRFKVYAYDGTIRTYTAKVNVHQQEPDSMLWAQIPNCDFSIKKGARQKALTHNGKVYVFAEGSDQAVVTSTDVTDGAHWTTPQALSGISETADYSSVVVFNDQFYILAQNKLYRSDDGLQWSAAGSQTFSQLISAGKQYSSDESLTNTFYGISQSSNRFISSIDGNSWTESEDDATDFPSTLVLATEYALQTNSRIDRQVVIGTIPSDTIAWVWTKLSTEKSWTRYEHALDNLYGCPRLNDLAIVRYDDKFFAFGGEKPFSTTLDVSAFGAVYQSVDNGITWKQITSGFTLPEDFLDRTEPFSYVVTSDNYVWIMWSESQEVWRGRINRLAFDK